MWRLAGVLLAARRKEAAKEHEAVSRTMGGQAGQWRFQRPEYITRTEH
jgi:hypothetical protein